MGTAIFNYTFKLEFIGPLLILIKNARKIKIFPRVAVCITSQTEISPRETVKNIVTLNCPSFH